MQIGKLDQIIELQKITETNNGGSLVQSWETVDTIWGGVLSQHGTEAFAAGRNNARAQIRVQLRYRDDIRSDWRIKWDGQYYNVTNIDASQRRAGELWLTAEVVEAK